MHIDLVPFSPEYLPLFFRWRQQASTRRHNPLDVLDLAALHASLAAEPTAPAPDVPGCRWFVRADGAVVGSVSYKNVNTTMGYAEIAYGFCETVHGRGIGTAAVRQMVDRVFAETTLRRLVAYVHDTNAASCRLLERLGFTREGLLREHFVIQGEPANEVAYGLLRREWPAPKSKNPHP